MTAKGRWNTQKPRFGMIRALWGAGKSMKEICAEMDCSCSSVYRALEEDQEFRQKTRRGHYAEKQAGTIRAMTAAGKTGADISRATGLSKTTIYNFWNRNGIHPKQERKPKRDASWRFQPPKKEVTKEQREIILDLAGQARPWSEIIEASGLSLHVCERVLKEADLWPKPVNEDREDEDPPWWPEPGAQKYPDEFVLKPEDRARLNEVIKWRHEGAPMTERNRKEKEGAEWKA